MKTLKLARLLMPTLFVSLLLSIAINAQTTAFTYQGRLSDASMAANGTYDFEFALYDANAGGTQQGAAQTVTGVNVSSGVFTVQLDFTATPFAAGANRYLEIRVKKPTDPAFTTLLPRQPLTSAPYAIQSLNATNATQLGGVAAANYLQFNGNGSQLTNVSVDAANLTGVVPIGKGGTGSATQNFVDLTTTQTVAGGKTFSSAVNTTTQYNIGGNRVLSVAGANNLFAGVNAGAANTVGNGNVFVGTSAGFRNTMGSYNSFVGVNAGYANTTGADNSFVGANAGPVNTTGSNNSFVGSGAGYVNTTGGNNSFFGRSAGQANTTGSYNSFVGVNAGYANTTAAYNSFFGDSAGYSNTTGSYNSFVGYLAGSANTTGDYNSFFGDFAGLSNTTASRNVFAGTFAGYANTTGGFNSFFGDGAGSSNMTGAQNVFVGDSSGRSNTAGYYNSFVGSNAGYKNQTGGSNSFVGFGSGSGNTDGDGNSFFGSGAGRTNTTGNYNTIVGNADVGSNNLSYATAIGAGAVVSTSNTIALGRTNGSDKIVIYGLGAAGSTQLCRNVSNQISTCSSSLRYKTNIAPFAFGLNVINRLRPISFDWKDGGMADVGFGAEDVAKINPLFVSFNDKGEVEGVKYDRLSVAFVNAFKEQQAQITEQQTQIRQQKTINQNLQTQVERQQREIDALKKIVCAGNSTADICTEK